MPLIFRDPDQSVTNSDNPRAGGSPEFRQKLRYRFDRVLARGTWATLLWLGIVTLGVVALSAVLLALFDVTFTSNEDVSFFEDFWQSILRVLDPGTMAGDVGWGRRFLALGITLFGLLVAGTLIGIIAAGVEERIDRMRGGRSVVFESGHVVVLGASDRMPTVIRQLVLANVGRRGNAIVVMADRDAVEMQDQVRRVVTDVRDSRLVFRSGDPTHRPDLEMVRLLQARTVIVLSDGDAGDSTAIRTVIAVDSVVGGSDVPIVVEVSEPASARLLAGVYATGVHPIVLSQGIGRIAAMALREPGLGRVVLALLDDRGNDVHVTSAPSLENRSFSEIHDSFPNARPIGYMASDGSVLLNPPPEAHLDQGNRIVLVSESENVAANPNLVLTTDDAPHGKAPKLRFEQPKQHLLVLGWSQLGALLLTDWVGVASSASTAEILLDSQDFDRVEGQENLALGSGVEFTKGADFADVANRLASSPPIDTILLLGSASELGQDHADSRTLLSLVALRSILSSMDRRPPRVIIEILDADNVSLVDVDTDNEFVVSDTIGSQLIAQLAEMPERRDIFLQLYDREGPSLHLIPPQALGLVGPTQASELYRTAYRSGVVAIGYRSAQGGLVLNPPPSHTLDLQEGDQFVVVG